MAELFYAEFLTRYPDVKHYFDGVEMQHQATILRMSISIVAQYGQFQFPAVHDYLTILGYRHRQREIPTDLYADWRDCMLDTLEQFHNDEWNPELEYDWRQAIDSSISAMQEGYELKSATI